MAVRPSGTGETKDRGTKSGRDVRQTASGALQWPRGGVERKKGRWDAEAPMLRNSK